MMKNKLIGILIGKKNYSESSLILSFYTEEAGLISFIFKGAKKKKIPIFYLGIYEITFFKRPESNLGIIQTMDSAVVLNEIFTNPQKLILSFFLVDLLNATLKVEQSDPEIFTFIKNQIIELEVKDDLLMMPILFLTNYIKYLGFSPIIDLERPKGFDLKSGRFTQTPTEFDGLSIELLCASFQNLHIRTDRMTAHKTLLILLDYCKLHLPNFNVDNSLKIIRDTLYS
jgi:DNA repair protein RecO (recombination protein O)